MRKVMIVMAVVALTGCGPSKERLECEERGVQFYKDAGTYPYLKSKEHRGTRTEDHVRSICRGNPKAFESYGK